MKIRLFSLLAAAAVALSLMSCTKNKSESSESSQVGDMYGYSEMEEKFSDTADADDGPQLSLSNTTAKAGGLAEVTLSVSNADLQWNMCGIHITYPDVFKCVLRDSDERLVDYKKGTALEFASGVVSMEWQSNLPEELTKAHQGCLFITAMFNGNEGQDGDIATFYFEVPENAQSGTVYDVKFYYMDSDIFSNEAGSAAFEKYAFEHAAAGTVTIE